LNREEDIMHVSRRSESLAIRAAKQIVVAGVLLAGAAATFAQNSAGATASGATSPVGLWQTIDDKTEKPKALVEITEESNGTLSGKVVKGLNPNENPDRRCTECTDDRRGQKILGMTIIRDMKREGDGWAGGNILDPENGKVYKCKMHLEDGGRKLVVRGFIGISLLGRSQTWNRQTAGAAQASN
jgi:uncharacterized protein (DUF2147 family)